MQLEERRMNKVQYLIQCAKCSKIFLVKYSRPKIAVNSDLSKSLDLIDYLTSDDTGLTLPPM